MYFTDSEAGAVWALAPKESKLRLLHHASPERFAYPNGIAFLPGERGLLVAHWLGLVTIELPGGRVAEVRAANDSAVSRIDGLYPACGGYVGIQNMASPPRVIAFRVEGGSASSVRELERGRAPTFGVPPPARSLAIHSSTLPTRRSDRSIRGRRAARSRRSWC